MDDNKIFLRPEGRKAALLARNMEKLAGTTTTETTNWIPRDVYARTVFMGLQAERVLGALAAAIDVDVEKGAGDTVKVRFFPKRTAQGPIAEGDSLVETASSALTVKNIKIDGYGDFDSLTYQAIQFTSDDVKARVLGAMASAIGGKLEQVTYDVLKNATGTLTRTIEVNGIIDYEEVLQAEALRKTGYQMDFLIISKSHNPDFLLDSNLTKTVDYAAGEVALPGEIGRIGNIRVLVHDLAVAKAATAGAVQGIMIDSSRAFGQGFGLPLAFYEDHIPKSNKWEQVAWTFFGAAVLDADAIVLLKNAA